MCYDAASYARKLENLEKRYGGVSYDRSVWKPEYTINAFGSPPMPTLTPDSPHTVHMIRWGFVPSFAKDAKDGATWKTRSVNCRADTLREKIENRQHSMFKPLVNDPCVILLDGFFEWHTLAYKTKVPYYISMKDGNTFAVAGFTSTWKDFAEPERVHQGFTLCTTSANNLLAWIHNKPAGATDFRMPAILDPEQISTWLDTELSPLERLSLITSYPESEMEAHSVVNYKKKDTRLGNVPEALAPFDYESELIPEHLDGQDFISA